MDPTVVLTTVIGILFGGLKTIAPLFGEGVSEILGYLLFTYDSTTSAFTSNLSVFGSVALIFGAIALAMGLARVLIKFCTGFGKSRYM